MKSVQTEFTVMGTVAQTAARAKAEGLGVSEHFIRRAVVEGTLPCTKAGKKYLINWNRFLDFLYHPAAHKEAIKE